MNTFLTNSTLISIITLNGIEKVSLGITLYGIVIKDETGQFELGDSIYSSNVTQLTEKEFISYKGNKFIISHENPRKLNVTLTEYIYMKDGHYSVENIGELRKALWSQKLFNRGRKSTQKSL